MNKKPPVNRRKIFWVIAIIAVAGIYQLAHPYLEQKLNVDLPSLMEDQTAVVDKPKREWNESDWAIPDVDDQQPLIGESANDMPASSDDSARPKITTPGSKQPFLVPTGKKNRLKSPAGLIYGESRGEHRVDHVMRHAKDDPTRPVHSVFEGDKDRILKLIDEAYELVKYGSSRVRKTPDKKLDFRAKYTVDMKKKIGYLGGQKGKRQNFPARSKLSLVLDNKKFMVTAYPDN